LFYILLDKPQLDQLLNGLINIGKTTINNVKNDPSSLGIYGQLPHIIRKIKQQVIGIKYKRNIIKVKINMYVNNHHYYQHLQCL
jgi:hypothetical protein